MTESPRTWEQALEFAQAQSAARTQDWTGYCQRFVRTAFGIPPLFDSAWAQWLGADDEDRHPAADHGGNPDRAPLGAALCFKGGEYGHIMLAARGPGAWSNDLVRRGEIDHVDDRLRPVTQWGQTYVGYLTAVNDYDLQLRESKPPRPKQDKRYVSVERAINRLRAAEERALELGDGKDAAVLRREIAHLLDLFDRLRHA